MSHTMILIHGHNEKPDAEQLQAVWCEAMRAGLQRDCPERVEAFDLAHKELVYFGDLNNSIYADRKTGFDSTLDIADRRNAIEKLRALGKPKKFNRYNYEQLPGKSALKEFLADIGVPVLGPLRLMGPVIAKLLPELSEYWDVSSNYYNEVSKRALSAFASALSRDGSVMVVSHGIGGIVAYDSCWKLSRADGQPGQLKERKIDRLLTMGTPLGDDHVRKHLAGAGEAGVQRYPANIVNWHNIAAEDDYISHDKTVADDFAAMLQYHLISVIDDFRIYNLAVRYGRSNPHSVVGYLVHPRVSRLLGDWLNPDVPTV